MSFYASLYDLCKTSHPFPRFWPCSFLLLREGGGMESHDLLLLDHRLSELELPWDLQ